MQHDAYEKPLKQWWETLDDQRGVRARLRRARTPGEVFYLPEFHLNTIDHLARCGCRVPHEHLPALAFVAGLLAHATDINTKHFAVLLAKKEFDKSGANAPMHRFKRLMAVRNNEQDVLYAMLLRLTKYVGETHIKSLLDVAFNWNDDARRDWTMRYFHPEFSRGE